MELNTMKAFKLLPLITTYAQDAQSPVTYKDVSGNVCTTVRQGYNEGWPDLFRIKNTNAKYGALTLGNGCLWLGTGSDAVTVEDYEITPVADNDLSVVSITSSQVVDGGKVYITVETTFRNETAAPITVSEVGFFKVFWTKEYTQSKVMLARETFEATPIAPSGTLSKSIVFVLS